MTPDAPFEGARRGVAGLLLAAGASRRMGERHKLLVELDGRPLVARAAAPLVEAGLSPLVVVTGHRGDEVAAAVGELGVELVHNPEHRRGQASSLAVGVAAVAGRCDAVVVALGDMPWIRAETVRAVVAAYSPAENRLICAPVREGEPRTGHPVLFSSRFFPELRRLTGDVGAREVVRRHPELSARVPVDDPGIHRDVDTTADL